MVEPMVRRTCCVFHSVAVRVVSSTLLVTSFMSWRVSLLGAFRVFFAQSRSAGRRRRPAAGASDPRSVIPDTTPHDMEGRARGGTVVKK